MKYWTLGAVCLLLLMGMQPIEACMPEPADMPADRKGMEPHQPAAAVYYLKELVREGKMTAYEAERTEVYMIFRNARRMQDLKAVQGMTKEERRAYMKEKRLLRGNPLKEYADHCGFSYERARELMDVMHMSDKGDKYYQQL